MPRKSRIQSGTGVYHVMMRGINRQRIFEDTEDHYIFLQCLSSAQEQYSPEGDRLPISCHYYAYALMSNHFHLLLHAKDDTVGNIVKRIASSYVYYFNKKYGRDGHLFKERFRSEPCERSRSMSDDQVMLYLFEEFGISDGQQLQRLDKEQRNDILSALLSRRAGIRQLQRLAGIGKNIISNIPRTILKQSGQ